MLGLLVTIVLALWGWASSREVDEEYDKILIDIAKLKEQNKL